MLLFVLGSVCIVTGWSIHSHSHKVIQPIADFSHLLCLSARQNILANQIACVEHANHTQLLESNLAHFNQYPHMRSSIKMAHNDKVLKRFIMFIEKTYTCSCAADYNESTRTQYLHLRRSINSRFIFLYHHNNYYITMGNGMFKRML